jgi:V/A-type H+-transporting ATPase subunit K
MKKIRTVNIMLLAGAALLAGVGTFFAQSAWAQVPAAQAQLSSTAMMAGFFSAALSVGLSCIGAGIAVSSVGSAAMGAMAEKPELAGRALIFVGLAEGIAIYGLIVAIMILGKMV